MSKFWRILLASNLAILPAIAQMKEAANKDAAPVNQLVIAGNACGPAALLSAFRFGDTNWRRAADAVPGENDRQRLRTIILREGMRPSKHLVGRARWSKSGVNVADLCDMANELTRGQYLPGLGYEVLFAKPKESPEKLLDRVHGRLKKSLDKGFPPVLSIRRFARKKGGWTVVDGHFVTIIGVPAKLAKGDRDFGVSYLDPWGGKREGGHIRISEMAFQMGGGDPAVAPCLEAAFPSASVGKAKVGKGEPTFISVSAAIGRW